MTSAEEAICPECGGVDLDQRLEEVSSVRKMVFIVTWLTSDPETYEGVTNADVEAGLAEEVKGLPYVSRVEKVTILDVEG